MRELSVCRSQTAVAPQLSPVSQEMDMIPSSYRTDGAFRVIFKTPQAHSKGIRLQFQSEAEGLHLAQNRANELELGEVIGLERLSLEDLIGLLYPNEDAETALTLFETAFGARQDDPYEYAIMQLGWGNFGKPGPFGIEPFFLNP